MNKFAAVFYFLPRAISLLISFVVFGFMTEGLSNIELAEEFFAIVVMIVIAFVIVMLAVRKKNTRLFSLVPLSYWAAILLFYFLGKYAGDFTFLQFGFLSVLTSSITALAYYTWHNSMLGGTFYLALGALYLFISYRQIDLRSLLLVVGVLFVTGILFILSPNNSDQTSSENSKKVLKGWKSLVNKEKSLKPTK